MPKNTSKFSGIYFKNNNMVSTDSYAINKFNSKNTYPEFWINNAVVAELLKWNNFTAIQINKMWLQLKSSDGTVFSARTLDLTKFPVDSIVNVLENSIKVEPDFSSEFTEDFYSAINRAASFSSEDEGHEVVCFNIFSDCSVIKTNFLQ